MITARLTDTKTGLTSWSEKFSGDLTNILAVQQQIAAGIVAAVRQQVVPKPEVASRRALPDAETYDLYLRARFHAGKRTEEGLRKSIALLEEVVCARPGVRARLRVLAENYLDLEHLACSSHARCDGKSGIRRRKSLVAGSFCPGGSWRRSAVSRR